MSRFFILCGMSCRVLCMAGVSFIVRGEMQRAVGMEDVR